MSLAPESFAKYFERHVVEDEQGRGWLDYRLGTGGTAELTNIEVARAHRRAGVGRALLVRMLAELPADVKTVFAFTDSANTLAHAWYRSMGFNLVYAPDFYSGMNTHAYLCIKVLS